MTQEYKQLAIKGHPTRGKEVIQLLEMLGGINKFNLDGAETNRYYYIEDSKIYFCLSLNPQNCIGYTLEKFLEKFPYKIGDKVSSKYLKNYEVSKMEWESVNNRVIYKLQGMGWYSADELQPYKEETMEEDKKAKGYCTEEEKDLLFKDLCARLDTNLVCSIYRTDDEGVGYRDEILHGYCKGDIWYEFYFREDCSISIDNVSKIKPYLFPLSSMTEEQKNAAPFESSLLNAFINGYISLFEDEELTIDDLNRLYDWFDKNHFDYRGLIPMGLAIDATGLNIY